MNHITQRNRIEQQLSSYKKFIKICPEISIGKLCIEIAKLEHRLDTIKRMNMEQLLREVPWQYSTRQSKANKMSSE